MCREFPGVTLSLCDSCAGSSSLPSCPGSHTPPCYVLASLAATRDGSPGRVCWQQLSSSLSPAFCPSVDRRSSAEGSLEDIAWCYTTRPLYGWGGRDPGHASEEPLPAGQQATAGWLAAFPVFEPHWQVCMAAGLSSGWIRAGRSVVHFRGAPSYAEKNWGASFPLKWFWVRTARAMSTQYKTVQQSGINDVVTRALSFG